jgi:phosphatidylinositol glycan class Q protein
MGTNNGLIRVFWPSNAASVNTSGVLVGFRNSDLDVLVVSILQDVEVYYISEEVSYLANLS